MYPSYLDPHVNKTVLSFAPPVPTKDLCKAGNLETLAYTAQLMLILGILKERYQEILGFNVHPLERQIETKS